MTWSVAVGVFRAAVQEQDPQYCVTEGIKL